MRKNAAMIGILIGLVCYSGIYAQSVQYIYNLQQRSINYIQKNEVAGLYCPVQGTIVFNHVYGDVIYDSTCSGYDDKFSRVICKSGTCAVGAFMYVKNESLITSSVTSGPYGLVYNNVNTQQYDALPMVAFTSSSQAMMASTSGIINHPFLRGIGIFLLALTIISTVGRKAIQIVDEAMKDKLYTGSDFDNMTGYSQDKTGKRSNKKKDTWGDDELEQE